jgi:hypothetical protein
MLQDQIPSDSQRQYAEPPGDEFGYLFSVRWNCRSLGGAPGLPCRRKKNVYLKYEKQESQRSECAALDFGKLHTNSFLRSSVRLKVESRPRKL